MTVLTVIKEAQVIDNYEMIQSYLMARGVELTRWQASQVLQDDDDQETILQAYAHEIKPFMQRSGYQSADVINVHKETPQIEQLRQKFLREHTHSEDEVRFFVDGEGLFWFHFDSGEVVSLLCKKGDFLSVPAGYRHWFDLAPLYRVKAIRLFSNTEGWVAHYTHSGIDELYNPVTEK